jgi:hypothetical protein
MDFVSPEFRWLRSDTFLAELAHRSPSWGAILFGEESVSLRIRVNDLLGKSPKFVLDLGGVTRIDSGGLGTLVALLTSARKVGGDIKLANLGNHAKEVLQIEMRKLRSTRPQLRCPVTRHIEARERRSGILISPRSFAPRLLSVLWRVRTGSKSESAQSPRPPLDARSDR